MPLKLETNADRPDLLGLEWTFLAGETALVPRDFRKANQRWDCGVHGSPPRSRPLRRRRCTLLRTTDFRTPTGHW